MARNTPRYRVEGYHEGVFEFRPTLKDRVLEPVTLLGPSFRLENLYGPLHPTKPQAWQYAETALSSELKRLARSLEAVRQAREAVRRARKEGKP